MSPRYGNMLLRINGPFTNPYQRQQQNHRMIVEQAFTVYVAKPASGSATSSTPTIVTGRLPRQVTDSRIEVLNSSRDGDPLEDPGDPIPQPPARAATSPPGTRWLRERIHLGAFAGPDVTIRLAYTGRHDRHGGSWAYFDATESGAPSEPERLARGFRGRTGHRAGHQLPGRLHRALSVRDGGRTRRRCGGRLDVRRFLGACAGTTCNLTMDPAKSVTATFDAGGAADHPARHHRSDGDRPQGAEEGS